MQAETSRPKVTAMLPGMIACVTASLAAAWLSTTYGMPIILMGLLVGLAMNFISRDERTHPGLDFASRTLLRIGIVILGTQVTLQQIAALGITPFMALLVVMACAFGAAILCAKMVRQPVESGVLAGGATAICGASAALALYGVIGKERLSQAQFSITLVGISLASALAMSFYPVLAAEIGLDDRQAGFLIGASIHDVAQAIGGGFAYSDEAGRNAAIVKLSRVALLAPIVALTALFLKRAGGGDEENGEKALPLWKRFALPWFITGFLALLLVNSLVQMPAPAAQHSLTVSKAMLLLAVTATAMRSRMDLIMKSGWRTLMPVVAATLASLLVGIAAAFMI
nr:putative sulfate exporter family transporter [Pacificimonas pallii]